MALRKLLIKAASGWPEYKKKLIVDANNPVNILICKDLPDNIQNQISRGKLSVKGSTGIGNLSDNPWVAIFHSEITNNTKSGYYVVYLFHSRMESLFLSFGLGCMQFEQKFGDNETALDKIEIATALLRKRIKPVLEKINKETYDKLNFGAFDLGAKKRALGKKYERGSAFSVQYSLSDLPDESVLIADLIEFTNLYKNIVTQRLEVTDTKLIDSLLSIDDSSEVDPATIIDDVADISLLDPTNKDSHSLDGVTTPQVSEVLNSSIKGIDEDIKRPIDFVVLQQQQKMKEYKYDLDKVHDATKEFPRKGFDIKSLDENGNSVYIKVSSSVFECKSVILTPVEFDFLQNNLTSYKFAFISYWKKEQEFIDWKLANEIIDNIKPFSYKVKIP